MPAAITDQVVDFYYKLFDQIFSEPFRSRITERLKRDAVIRQVEDAAGAASQSLTRFFLNEQLNERQVASVLRGFSKLKVRLTLADISSSNATPEALVETLLIGFPCPKTVQQADQDAIYRIALHSIVQVLMLVGPVMAEWQKLNFSSTFELPRRIVNRLNQISETLGALGRSGESVVDENYELTYRDYLLQRFHRVEAGTVRMTTNLDVDLRELFVMPHVQIRSHQTKAENNEATDSLALMNLATAREYFGNRSEQDGHNAEGEKDVTVVSAIDQVKRYPRNILVGLPGSGKSTFLEWLQLRLAAVDEELIMAGTQAIPLLLRLRQLDPKDLPMGAALIEKATASKDRATLMPPGWIDRQMKDGRILFMLDGLDETEPELRDRYVLPWLIALCEQYPTCRFLVSSRPVGYAAGTLRKLEFTECELLDFAEPQISEYTQHWCTAVRLARNEPDEEARREGTADGEQIVNGFKGHPYIRNLARNPLMLSAICLVNYFEGGQLPQDRAVLYQLCVEGLLHHWDQRRGIHSDFTLDEKLRACREVALTMQSNDRAEYEVDNVQTIFRAVLGDNTRAEQLQEHIRYRTGLLLERRSGIFAFAHLTFQEYLAALAAYEGNQIGMNATRLVDEHNDGRWKEVIALYCGLAPTSYSQDMVEQLIAQPDSRSLGTLLAEAYLSAGPELYNNRKLRKKVIERIAIAPSSFQLPLGRFELDEVAPIANVSVGRKRGSDDINESYRWLFQHPELLDAELLAKKIQDWRHLGPVPLGEIIYLLHAYSPNIILSRIADDKYIYRALGSLLIGQDNGYIRGRLSRTGP